jgi:hypothetical protein
LVGQKKNVQGWITIICSLFLLQCTLPAIDQGVELGFELGESLGLVLGDKDGL